MTEEVQEVPKWLKELEEKRERRLKARLGHEAGAGSPCLSCGEKCPGLDLHFWRKICKICKCGKESHDVNDDDIYGWAQFQLLGSKPSKSKKIVLPGRKDAVELEWTPKGQNDAVESYLKDLPLNLLPIKGSTAAQERKQLLQKQIPLHDIDPNLCHALSENEVKQMNDYIAHVKQNSVGVGHILKLNELLMARRENAQILASRAPMQIPQMQNIALQGVNHANLLKGDLGKELRDLSINEQKHKVEQSEQVASNVRMKNIAYGVKSPGLRGNVQLPQKNIESKIDYQNAVNVGDVKDIRYAQGSLQVPYVNCNTNSYQNPSEIYYKDVTPSMGLSNEHPNLNLKYATPLTEYSHVSPGVSKYLGNKGTDNLQHYAESTMSKLESTQKPVSFDLRDIYPDVNVNFDPSVEKHEQLDNSFKNRADLTDLELDNISHLRPDHLPHYVPGKYNTFVQQENPQRVGNIRDLPYSTYDASKPVSEMKNPQYPVYNPNQLDVIEQNVSPTSVNVSIINDIDYYPVHPEAKVDFKPELPKKNVQFDPNVHEIFPACHNCKKMFDATALVIGIHRTDDLWHAECFKCAGCSQNLADLMYFYDQESDNIYCGRDYAKIRGIPRCQACDELIFVKEYCLAENSTFHVKHFCCFECDVPLAGQNYVMEDSQPLCLPCFEKIKAEKCISCLQVIKPDEQGANLNGVHFHADDACFSCETCEKPLLGAKFLFKNSKLYCSAQCFAAGK